MPHNDANFGIGTLVSVIFRIGAGVRHQPTLRSRLLLRALLVPAAIAAAITLAGCGGGPVTISRDMQPLSERMLAELKAKKMEKESPILMRIFKEEAELEVWKQDDSGRFALLRTYPICRWSGELGPKIKTGDRQAPEGFYTITPGLMNPNSSQYLAINTGLPECVRPCERPHRLVPDDPRRLLIGRLLRHDRRADRGNLRARPRSHSLAARRHSSCRPIRSA